jgi:hypothetical protein
LGSRLKLSGARRDLGRQFATPSCSTLDDQEQR